MSTSLIESLYKQDDLASILARETEFKPEGISLNSGDFFDDEDEDHQDNTTVPSQSSIEDQEPVEPYDAETNARSLVYGLQGIEAPLLNAAAVLKTRQLVGGRKVIQQMRDAIIKEMSGEELTDKEQRLIKSFEIYEKKLNLLGETLLPKEAQTEALVKSAIPYCEAKKLDVNPGLGFYGHYVGDLVTKITTILLM